jgi:putative endopeptidase
MTNPRMIHRGRLMAAATGLALAGMVNIGTGASIGTPTLRAAPEPGVNTNIVPGDDFFAYANGDWLNATTVPAGRARWGARNEIDATAKRQVAELITTADSQTTNEAARKVGDFHAAYLDEAALEARGLAPLAPLLESIDQIRDRTALAKWLGGHMPVDVDPLDNGLYISGQPFGLAVQHGIRGETKNFPYLLQGGLGLSERAQYLDDTAPAREARDRYQRYVARVLELAGVKHAPERAAAVLALETALARGHAASEISANDHNADHHWSREDFAAHAPGMDWPAFFAAAGLARQKDIVAWQPDAMTATAALIGSRPLPVWQDYLRFHLVDRFADVLPRAFAAAALEFRAAGGAPAGTRAERAVEATNRFMPWIVGRLYVDRYFSFDAKANVQAILANVLDAFRRRVQAAPWMTPASKTVALAKLDTLYFGVGYPDKWPDDSRLAIDRRDAFGNLQRIADWNYRDAIARLDQPVDRHEWSITPQSSVATLNFLENTYNFSAALLQPPKFDPAGSQAANYGAIGATIGHEISHFVDTLGADYDASGAFSHWWSTEDKARFDSASRPLADQFSGYQPFEGLSIDGALTASENVADLGGLTAAFDAYRRVLGSRADNAEYLRQQDRLFFIGFARAYRAKFTDEGLRAQSKGNDHAPEMYRISTVRNFDAWYDAFDVQPGQRLYLEPKARVRIW